MDDYKIVIDAGRGGEDLGTSNNEILEKNLNLELSKDMYDKFRELQIPVKLTRDSDETLSPAERVNRILNAYGDNKNVIVISNHMNVGGGTRAECD